MKEEDGYEDIGRRISRLTQMKNDIDVEIQALIVLRRNNINKIGIVEDSYERYKTPLPKKKIKKRPMRRA